MAERAHIVIVATGGSFWLGGLQYSKNIIEALTRFRGTLGDYAVSVVAANAAEMQSFAELAPSLRTVTNLQDMQAPYSLVNRVRWRGKRMAGAIVPRLDEALARMGATFAYPIASRHVNSADWIADFQYAHHPDKMSAEEIAARERQFGGAVRHAMRIALSSAHAQEDCLRLFPQSRGRTSVLPFRVFARDEWRSGDPAATVAKYNLPPHFALVSNWLLPTKNHALALEAVARIPAAERSGLHLVCTGDIYDYRNPGFYNSFFNTIHKLGLRDHVSVLGIIPKHDQIQLLRAATLYLQPSLFEGWNTGVEEARLFGKRIVLSDIPVHREQNPPRATFFDPHDAGDLAAKLRETFGSTHAGDGRDAEQAAAEAYARLQRTFAATFLALTNSDHAS